MKLRLLDHIVCPLCAAPFEPARVHGSSDEIESGVLVCTQCGHEYPVEDGIPRLLPPGLSLAQRRTAEAFGWQWRHFVEMFPAYEAQFLDWLAPLQPSAFEDKIVLDAGCGIGRHAYFAATYGATEVIAM